ncbi:MAG: hypothetical protein ISS36_04370 [Candidatus Aenigmarchaeota archaeon]|nr:hypothetical protein [Candidatus Aenigmarchaeota archaeon]
MIYNDEFVIFINTTNYKKYFRMYIILFISEEKLKKYLIFNYRFYNLYFPHGYVNKSQKYNILIMERPDKIPCKLKRKPSPKFFKDNPDIVWDEGWILTKKEFNRRFEECIRKNAKACRYCDKPLKSRKLLKGLIVFCSEKCADGHDKDLEILMKKRKSIMNCAICGKEINGDNWEGRLNMLHPGNSKAYATCSEKCFGEVWKNYERLKPNLCSQPPMNFDRPLMEMDL